MQIWTQCKFAALAYDDLAVEIGNLRSAHAGKNSDLMGLSHEELRLRATESAMDPAIRAWQPIQSLLTSVANISKALWGQRGKFSVEREPLRAVLGVPDTSPLAPTQMRNNFDHFDERLDEWWARSTDHNYVDLNFGDVASTIQGVSPEDMFRSYDPQSGNVAFWGQQYNLPTIMNEIERIAPLALRASI